MSALTKPLDALADWVENRLPWWLTYNGVGDAISWSVDHPAWTLLAAAVGRPWHHEVLMAWAAVAVYFVREAFFDGPQHLAALGWENAVLANDHDRNPWCTGYQVGWLTDGIMDWVCTAIVATMVTLWGLGIASLVTAAQAVVVVSVLRYKLRNTPRRV